MMNAGRAAGASGFAPKKFHSVSAGFNWIIFLSLAFLMLLCMMAGAGWYPLLSPDEAKHAGIVHDMWAARQYLIPRINGLPTLDGAPLYYWLSLGFLFLFGAQEWTLRLPSAISVALILVVMVRVWHVGLPPRSLWVWVLLLVSQPALMLAGRFAAPDMLNVFLLAAALGCFLRAACCVEMGNWSGPWTMSAWFATALLGLGAGPLAVFLPMIVVGLWLMLRRRFDILASLCWWPGVPAVVLLLLPWQLSAEAQYPGIIAATLQKQLRSLIEHGSHGWTTLGHSACWPLMLAGILPLVVCLYRYRDPVRRQVLRTPVAGLMAVWLAVLIPLHPLMTMTVAGHAMVLVIPLLYFGVLAMVPGDGGPTWEDARAWLAYVMLVAVVAGVGLHFFAQRLSKVFPVTQVISKYYSPTTDKVIMLDRYEYEFNFYMRSPKLVYVAADWSLENAGRAPSWKKALLESAGFAPETAKRLLLTTRLSEGLSEGLSEDLAHEGEAKGGNGAGSGDFTLDDLLDKLCERRVVNLWIIGSEDAPRRHAILADLTTFVGTGKVRAWYLDEGVELARCALWSRQG